jgi:hypothetical protein
LWEPKGFSFFPSPFLGIQKLILLTDIKIFHAILANFLEPYKRVKADEGYVEHPDKIKCLVNAVNSAEKLAMQVRVWARHRRLKSWGILDQVFEHIIRRHVEVFWACTVLTQLTIVWGEPLFCIEYEVS